MLNSNSQEPLVSILMSTYNGEKFIRKQLDSILAQTYQNFELIVCDDCSRDDTLSVVREYASKDRRIRVLQNEYNKGYIYSFIEALPLAQGEYISFADQDDIWLPHKIEKLVDNIGKYALIYSDAQYMDANDELIEGECVSKYRSAVTGVNFSIFAWKSRFSVFGFLQLFRKKIFNNEVFPKKGEMYAHDCFATLMGMKHGGITYVDEVLAYYRQHDNNVTGGLGGNIKRSPKTRNKTEEFSNLAYHKYVLSNVPLQYQSERLLLERCVKVIETPIFMNRFKLMLSRIKHAKSLYFKPNRGYFRKIIRAIKDF